MYSLRRRILSQNFLYDRKLVESLVRKSSIGLQDTILEIGSGKGIITEELLRIGRRVIAVEFDTRLYFYLQKKLNHFGHKLQLIHKDFLQYKLPKYPYKVFANIPFSIEGKIIRKLLTALNPPEDSYLVMRKDLAERLGGFKKECQFSIFYKPWFIFEIIHYFRRTDFTPFSRMDTVLLRFEKRKEPLLKNEDKKSFMIFVGQGFGGGKKLRYNLQMFFTREQFLKLSQKYRFNHHARPSDLKLDQWIGVFDFIKNGRISFTENF